jgi:hypothetical protein
MKVPSGRGPRLEHVARLRVQAEVRPIKIIGSTERIGRDGGKLERSRRILENY